MELQERPIGYWLKHLDRLIEQASERALAEEHLTRRHWQIMNVLRKSPLGPAALADALRPFWGPGRDHPRPGHQRTRGPRLAHPRRGRTVCPRPGRGGRPCGSAGKDLRHPGPVPHGPDRRRLPAHRADAATDGGQPGTRRRQVTVRPSTRRAQCRPSSRARYQVLAAYRQKSRIRAGAVGPATSSWLSTMVTAPVDGVICAAVPVPPIQP